ncbi:branched-chain amino acid ABC transporter permease [Serpentinicella sp. ANB-PHB4]|uniref:branched-chain amino acid ABC transporter permease n=1 Tax=Serpentinicella sp. ANB-PHB4 TaxID=3074076 RepID=UPI002856D972|nr:branched-chain amino acid ABC transporter permease [Serpentinicella sp. ANB-PHB4]MDR5658607.1 branched-chain amino acid ABC transporter permease [Serpentinicella sp. ANB-PHB4]
MGAILTLLINGLAQGALIFLMASGLSIILGMMGVINFAHGTLFLWGGYSYVWAYYVIWNRVAQARFPDAYAIGQWGGSVVRVDRIALPSGQALPFHLDLLIFLAALIIAVAIVFFIGMIFEKLFINKVYNNAPAQILVTLGLQVIFTDVARFFFGTEGIQIVPPNFLNGTTRLWGGTIVHYNIFVILVGLAVALIIHRIITKSRIGMVIRAGLQSPEHVKAIGINIRRYFTYIFAVGAGLAALGGALYMPFVGAVTSTAGMNNQILAFIVIVVGGLGSFLGSAFGSVFIGLMTVVISLFVPALSVVANVLVMALVLVFKPNGLFGMAVNN